jgi:hypothetical protein
MRQRACQLCLIIATAVAAPAAVAGPDIVKCIDADGRVTLTDQPCSPGSKAVPMAIQRTLPPAVTAAQLESSVERYVVPPRQLQRGKWRPPQAKRTPLSRDVATLKAARAQLLMQDEARGQQPRLAVN